MRRGIRVTAAVTTVLALAGVASGCGGQHPGSTSPGTSTALVGKQQAALFDAARRRRAVRGLMHVSAKIAMQTHRGGDLPASTRDYLAAVRQARGALPSATIVGHWGYGTREVARMVRLDCTGCAARILRVQRALLSRN